MMATTKIETGWILSDSMQAKKVTIKIGPPIQFKIPDDIAVELDEAICQWYAALGWPIPEEISLDLLLAAMELVEKK
jgi:hypothetical protein